MSQAPSFWAKRNSFECAPRRRGTPAADRSAMPRRMPPAVTAAVTAGTAAERTSRSGRTPAALADRRLLRQDLAGLDPLVAQDGLAAETDAIPVHLDHLHEDLLALLDLVLDLLDAMLGHLGDVQQSLETGKDLHEGPEVRDA